MVFKLVCFTSKCYYSVIQYDSSWLFFFFQVYLFWERERQKRAHAWARGGEQREGKRKSQADSMLSTWRQTQGSNSRTVRSTWAKIKSWLLNQLSHPGTPIPSVLKMLSKYGDFILRLGTGSIHKGMLSPFYWCWGLLENHWISEQFSLLPSHNFYIFWRLLNL